MKLNFTVFSFSIALALSVVAEDNLLDANIVDFTGTCGYNSCSGDGDPQKLLDGNVRARWLMYGTGQNYDYCGDLVIKQDISVPVNGYEIWVGGQDDRCPVDWVFYGSNDDGATWVKLDERTGIEGWVLGNSQVFRFDNATVYSKFKFHITSPTSLINISEIAFYSYKADDWLEIASSAENFEVVSPAYGMRIGVASGEQVVINAEKKYFVDVETSSRHEILGFSILDADGVELENHSVDECPFTYTHPGEYRKIIWKWHDQYTATVNDNLSSSILAGVAEENLTWGGEHSYGSEGYGDRLFNKDSNRYLGYIPSSAWLICGVDLPAVYAYDIKSSPSPDRSPVAWKFYGSNDGGETWSLIDERTTTRDWTQGETRRFFTGNKTPYKAFKFDFLENQAGTVNSFVQVLYVRLYSVSMPGNIVQILGEPKAYGDISPAYGFETNLTAGAVVEMEASSEEIVVSESERTVCSGYRIISENGRDERGSATSFDYVHDGSFTRIVWDWSTQYRLSPSVDRGGSVLIDGEAVDEVWRANESVIRLEAVASTGYEFAYWAGADAPSGDERTQTGISLACDRVLDIKAVFAPILYVDGKTGSDQNDGISWASPLSSVAAALAGAGSIGTVKVKPGEYVNPSVEAIEVPGEVKLVAEGAREEVVLRASVDGGRVLKITGEDALVSGFTVAGGVTDENGGGIYMQGGVVSNCLVVSCSAAQGGGIYSHAEDALVTGCVISNCTASSGSGGGITLSPHKSLVVENSTISDCSASGQGGGVSSVNSDVARLTLKRCVVTRNVGSGLGGGVNLDAGSLVYNCLFSFNTNRKNSAIFMRNAKVFNSTIVRNAIGNMAYSGLWAHTGAKVYNTIVSGTVYSPDSTVATNLLTDSSTVLKGCLINDQTIPEKGDIDASTLFSDPKLQRDFTLKTSSPAVNAGINEIDGVSYTAADVDLKGNPRIYKFSDPKKGIVDIGCYELQRDFLVPGLSLSIR